jgi:uncharacterized protein YggE
MPNMYYYREPQMYDINEEMDERLITVVGTGKVDVEPDTAILKIGVITKDTDIIDAQDENKNTMNAVIEGLISNGIDETDIKTIQYTVTPQYDYIDGKQVFREYEIRHVLEVTIKDTNKVGVIIDDAVKDGANYQQGLTFAVDNPENYYDRALQLAVINSQEKATNIANTLQGNINMQPIKITEKTRKDQIAPYEQSITYRNGGTPIQTGKLSIISTVEATYEY